MDRQEAQEKMGEARLLVLLLVQLLVFCSLLVGGGPCLCGAAQEKEGEAQPLAFCSSLVWWMEEHA